MPVDENDLPKASIVVPCFNAERTIARCVEACLQQDYPNLELIFVDDGSDDSTTAILGTYDGITVVTQKNKGPAAARNLGWRVSSGQIVCFTDADCVPNPRWVSRLVERYTHLAVGGVGGSYNLANAESWLARCIQEESQQLHLGMPNHTNFLGSFNASYRRSVLEQADGFDERFRRASGEDNDLSYRVIDLGYKLSFDAANSVAHYHPEHLWSYMRRQFWHGYWRIELYKKHPNRLHGDDLYSLPVFVQLPLSLLAVLAWALSWVTHIILYLAIALSALVLLGEIPMTGAIVRRTRHMQYLPFALVMMARDFVRGLGMTRAFLGSTLAEILGMIVAFIQTLTHRKASHV